MDQLLALLRLALERGWTLGLLLIIGFGLVILGQQHGFKFPEIASTWAPSGLVFGLATFVVSATANLIRWLQSFLNTRRDAAEVRRHDEQEARANLELLTSDEKATLVGLLKQGRSRFEVRLGGPAYELLVKGILVEVRRLGLSGSVCDFHPGVIAIKRELLRNERI